MTDDALKETIARLAEPVATSLGLVIWGVEIVRAGRTVVRLFVDVPFPAATDAQPDPAPLDNDDTDAPALVALSASLGQCEEISRHVALALEVEDTIPEAYVLEVSTPGLTRLFFSLDQMRHYMGDVVEARLLRAVAINEGAPEGPNPSHGGPRRIWRGELLAVEDDSFTLAPATISPEGDVMPEALPPVVIPWEAVRRASRMYIFRQPQKPGKGRTKTPAGKAQASKGKAEGKPGKTKKSKSSGSEENL
jgi:ribosome maturation factor RimP